MNLTQKSEDYRVAGIDLSYEPPTLAQLEVMPFGTHERLWRELYRARRRVASNIRWALLFGFLWGLTPYIFVLADRARGFDATGGEVLFPLLPLLIYYI